MPDDVTTRLKISADDKEVKKLKNTIKDSFTTKDIRAFKDSARDLEREITKLTKTQSELTKKLLGVEKGTKAYKELKDTLKGVKEQADLVNTSLTQLDRIQSRAEQQRKMGRGPGFVAGLAQGAGVGQYIPTGRQMGSRIGGMMVGGMLRRGVGGAAAPFLTPGVGGLAQAAQAIPLMGGLASASISAGATAYQSAVAYDRARLQNLYFAGPQMGQTWERGPTEAQTARVAEIQARQRMIGKRGAIPISAMKAEEKRLFEEAAERGGISPKEQQVGMQRLGMIRKLAPGGVGGYGRAAGIRTRPRPWDALRAKAQQNILVERGQLAEDLKAAQEAAKPTSGVFSGLGAIGLGTQFGIAPQQTEAMKGQFFQMRGGVFGREAGGGRERFMEAMLAQGRFGVSMQQAGGFERMRMAGGGGTGMGGLIDTLQAAVAQGLEGAQVPEYLQALVGLGQEAEKRGVKIDSTEFIKTTMTLRAAGIQGPQLGRIGAGLQQAGMNVSAQGVQSPMDVLMARAAGFDPSGGPESYAMAMNKLAGGLDQDMMNRLMGMVTSGAMTGGGPEMQSLLFRRALSKIGVQLGPGQATSLLESYKGGQVPTIEDLEKATTAQGGVRGAMMGLKRGIDVVAPTARGAAGLEAERIGIGRGATWVLDFERNAVRSAKAINNFGTDLKKLSGAVDGFIKTLTEATKGGASGIMERMVKMFLKSVNVNIPEGE